MPEPTTPGQRFLQLIQQLGLTKNAFAQSLGKTATVIQHIVDERNKPGYDLLNRVCEVYPNVSSEWLLRGLGPMLRQQNSPAPAAEPAPVEPSPATDGIDLREVPHAPRRRPSHLLQPADIAATLALATPAANGNSHGLTAAAAVVEPAPAPSFAATAIGPPAPAPAVPPAYAEAAPAEAAPAGVPLPSAVATATPVAAAPTPAAVAAPTAPPTPALPDPAYLAAALQTQHLQHQLALAEQRNQHLLEQQTLLRQMVELLQR